jgi:hypothetical protein
MDENVNVNKINSKQKKKYSNGRNKIKNNHKNDPITEKF